MKEAVLPAELIEQADSSLLDVIDHVLNQGVVLNGEIVLSLAAVDLVYIRISAIVCAADRVLPRGDGGGGGGGT